MQQSIGKKKLGENFAALMQVSGRCDAGILIVKRQHGLVSFFEWTLAIAKSELKISEYLCF